MHSNFCRKLDRPSCIVKDGGKSTSEQSMRSKSRRFRMGSRSWVRLASAAGGSFELNGNVLSSEGEFLRFAPFLWFARLLGLVVLAVELHLLQEGLLLQLLLGQGRR